MNDPPPGVFDGAGSRVALGRELGSGGEGRIFEILKAPGQVAKIYHRQPGAEQAAKIEAMAAAGNPDLAANAAWPTAALYKRGGAFAGLLMPRLDGFLEIHHLYGPAYRKKAFPKADWGFLVGTAARLARAFAVIHAHGHVVGDVNQGNVLVAPDGRVQLIDCDSYQIAIGDTVHPCDVGVLPFTPPELQGGSFRGRVCTPDHDAFGLAVLCFHLLFLGRHPFAGRFHGPGEMPIEQAIREHRFAFGHRAAEYLMSPPPQTLALAACSDPVADLFERAFTGISHGADASRPSAEAWGDALELLTTQITRCATQPMHAYPRTLTACPWCQLERDAGAHFFLRRGSARLSITDTGFDLDATWARVLAVRSPGEASLPPVLPNIPMRATPLPPAVLAEKRRILGSIASVCFMGGLLGLSGLLDPLWTLGVCVSTLGLAVVIRSGDGGEGMRRRETLDGVQRRWSELNARWRQVAADEDFTQRLRELAADRQRYLALLVAPAANDRDLALVELARHLAAAPEELVRLREHIQRQREGVFQELRYLAPQLAQARADLGIR